MNIKELKELVNLMNENNLAEIEIEKEGLRIHLKKTAKPAQPEAASQVVTGEHYSGQQHSVEALPSTAAGAQASQTTEIKAPMVGTFYRAAAPDAAPFVESGQLIEPGQVICIIEAMKLMNEIKSEVKGKVVEVLVDNAEPVEFGQPMFLIEPV